MTFVPFWSKKGLTKVEFQDNQTIFALCVIFFVPAINNFVNSILQLGLSVYFPFVTPISYIFMALVSGMFLFKLMLKKKLFLGIFAFGVFACMLSYVLYPEIRSIIYGSPVDLVYSPVNKLIFFCIPALVGTACVSDYQKMLSKMRVWSLVTAILGVATYLFVVLIKGEVLQYMVYSYFMLLPVCVCFEYSNMQKTKLDFIVAVVGSISMVVCGARGALLSLLMYFLISVFHYDFRRLRSKQVLQLFVVFSFIVIIFLFYDELLDIISRVFEYLNIDSRSIDFLQDDAFFDDSGRTSIARTILDGILANPIGYGLYGDRYVSGTFGTSTYHYAHNIFLELFCDFGIVGGIAAITILAYLIVNMIASFKNKNEIHLVFAIIPYAIFQLQFSSTYLENIPFFALLGIAISCIMKKSRKRDTEESL